MLSLLALFEQLNLHLNELSVGTFPLLDVVGRRGGEHVQLGVQDHGSHRFLVVGQGASRLAVGQVPETNSLKGKRNGAKLVPVKKS